MQPINLLEYEPLAAQKLPRSHFDFIAGAAEDEVTLRENRAAFQRVQLRPRFLVDVSQVDLSTQALGQQVEMPVLLAPVALQKLAHPEGELATARAAAAAGVIMALSTVSSYTLEEVAAAAQGTKWFQLYRYEDAELSKQLVARAKAAGYSAICVTVDVPRLGRREADFRNRLQFPPDIFAANLVPPRSSADSAGGLSGIAPALFHRPFTWRDLDWVRSTASLPIILKGILTAEDARLAVEHGVQGIIVSNHGGRQLDGVPAAIEALPEVVEAVEGRAEVLLDSGVRRGTDILKALALGARAVLIGRPYVWGLAVAGEPGVGRVLTLLRDELELAMALSGRRSISEIDRSLVRLPGERP